MVSLEALRESLIRLEDDVADLIECHEEFEHNFDHILDNLWDAHQPWIAELTLQQKRLAKL